MTERPNIRRLNIPETRDVAKLTEPFDPRRDITRNDWSRLKGRLEDERGEDLTVYFRMLAHLHVIDPAEWQLPSEEALLVPQILDDYQRNNDWGNFLHVGAASRILQPDVPLLLDEVRIRGIRKELEDSTEDENWPRAAQQLMEARIIAPDIDWGYRKDALRWSLKWDKETSDVSTESIRFSAYTGAMHAMLPEDKLEITPEMWQALNADLARIRSMGDWTYLASRACNMSLMAAEDVRITKEKGLEITLGEPRQKELPEIPAQPEQLQI